MLSLYATMPIVVGLFGFRLGATTWFSAWEFQRPGFPVDAYGLTAALRMQWSEQILHCVTSGSGFPELALAEVPPSARSPERDADVGDRLLGAREIRHLIDVARFYATLRMVWAGSLVLLVGAVLAAARLGGVALVCEALARAALGTVIVLTLGAAIAAMQPDRLLDTVHAAFFEGNSFLFYGSDTLIRLYPPTYWRDYLLLAAVFDVAVAVAVFGGARLLLRTRAHRTMPADSH